MLKKIKNQWKQKKQTRGSSIQAWKKSIRDSYDTNFPVPQMDKSTDHLIEKDQVTAVSQSMKTTKQILKFWLIWLAIVVLWYMMYISLSYIYMVIAAFIISLALEWCILLRQRLTRSRWLWILITYLIAVIFILSWFIILVPFFFNWWNELLQSLMTRLLWIESSINQLWLTWFIDQINRLPWFMKEQIIERLHNSNTDNLVIIIRDNIGSIMSTSSGYLKVIASQALSIFGNIFVRIADLAIVLTLCVFFSIAHYDIKYMLKFIFRHMSSSWSRIDAAYSWITKWLKNQLFLCIFIWITSYIGLRILEIFGISIPQKATLAVLAWLFEIIPYLGPFLWAIPAAVSGLIFTGRWWVLAVIILYTIIQQTEEKLLVPVFMWKTLWVSPLVVFICMLLCGTIMWFFWVLLAVPMAVIVSLAFHVPQAEEMQSDSNTKENKQNKPKLNFKKTKISTKKK